MFIVDCVNNIRTWVANWRPDVVEQGALDAVVEMIRSHPERPRYGTDWEYWLDLNADTIIAAHLGI